MGKIYTKKGDLGETCTMMGKFSKGDMLPEVLGSIDELNSWIGVCRSQIADKKLLLKEVEKKLKNIQGNLMTIASVISGNTKPNNRLIGNETDELEKMIDELAEKLPKLTNFIYPVGYFQVARAVCRRTEREVVRYMNSNARFSNKAVLKYMNRLSDAMFMIARQVNYTTDTKEETWGK